MCLLATDLNTETITLNHYKIFLSFLIQSPWTAGSLYCDLQQVSSPILSPVGSSHLAANTLSFYSLGILLTYIDAARTPVTENTSRDRYPLLTDITAHHMKHISRDCYTASPLNRWLLPSTDHIESTSRDRYPLVVWRHCACASYADTQKTLLLYCLPRMYCGRCLAIDLHVAIYYNIMLPSTPVSPKWSVVVLNF
jgi:hypothetical protein